MCGARSVESLEGPGSLSWRTVGLQAAGLYAVSRALYLLVGLVVSVFMHGTKSAGGILGFHQPWHAMIFNLIYTSDSAFYHSIAMLGYRHVHFNTSQQYNWAFFPLYPYLTRWTRQVVGIHVVDAGVLWSQIGMLAFLVVLGRFTDRKLGPKAAFLAMLIAAFSPLTPYFVAYRAGALFLGLSMAFFYLLEDSRWIWAATLGALAGLSRPVGILLAVPYLVAVVMKIRRWPPRIGYALAGAGIGIGFLTVGWIDWRFTQNPLAFLAIQKAWNRHSAFPFHSTWHWFFHPVLTSQGGWALPPLAMVFSALAVGAGYYLWHQHPDWWPSAAYVLITVLLANASNSFEGVPRFIAELPPIYVAAASWLEPSLRRQWLTLMIVGGFFAAYATLWALGVHAVQN